MDVSYGDGVYLSVVDLKLELAIFFPSENNGSSQFLAGLVDDSLAQHFPYFYMLKDLFQVRFKFYLMGSSFDVSSEIVPNINEWV